ncbi:MAG: hypothetical protein D6722_10425, partial [Bacteroidetes bacterium]
MTRYLLWGYLCMLPVLGLRAQLEASWWPMREGRALHFLQSPPLALDSARFPFSFVASTSMCDAEGNLRFYGDWRTVMDSSHTVMPFSQPLLNGNQDRVVGQVLAIETPDPDRYLYALAEKPTFSLWRVRVMGMDMQRRGGLGDFTGFNQHLITTGDEMAMAGGYACEADAYWLLTVSSDVGTAPTVFHAFRRADTAFVATGVISTINDFAYKGWSTVGTGTFRLAPDMTQLLCTAYDGSQYSVWKLTFDPQSGQVSQPQMLTATTETIPALAWAPGGRYAYVVQGPNLYQYDTQVPNPIGTLIAAGVGSTLFPASLQQIPGGAILVTAKGRNSLDMIAQPDQPGSAADFRPDEISLTYTRAHDFLPQFGAHYFAGPVLSGEMRADTILCPGDSLRLRHSYVSPEGFVWSPPHLVDDPLAREPIFRFASIPRQDTVVRMTLQLRNGDCVFRDVVSLTIKGQPAPPPIVGSRVVCPYVDSVRYWVPADTLGGGRVWRVTGGEILAGQGSDTILVRWFEAQDAEVRVARQGWDCVPDTGRLPVRVKVRLEPPRPAGPVLSCWEPGQALGYEVFPPTHGSVYTWYTQGGQVEAGQGRPRAHLSWDTPGTYPVWVAERSETIDTVCDGRSDTLWVTVYADSSRLALARMSFGWEDPERIVGLGWAALHPLADSLTLNWLQVDSLGNRQFLAFLRADSLRLDYLPPAGQPGGHYRLEAVNSCGDSLLSAWHQLIQLEAMAPEAGPIALSW